MSHFELRLYFYFYNSASKGLTAGLKKTPNQSPRNKAKPPIIPIDSPIASFDNDAKIQNEIL